MAVYSVVSTGEAGSAGMTFEQAVAAANANPEADTIRFDSGLRVIRLSDELTITGELTIQGDHNNDGVSDIMLRDAADERHLSISSGANVTITNVNFCRRFRPAQDLRGSAQEPGCGWHRRRLGNRDPRHRL
ncbi:hypothetical protein [Ruegeria aquimaris]|uniref:Uncharacterized protein n=1 Tax=Ruegeria aquimaris TaxID=2984333 RepID=A0ABT3AR90_9RHOB|nr:hypothetical protein [Ruegeria sp. XHP0148]MCV2891209.1 hypothetical protein [Ruegeria sp. XHP0148]